MRIIAGELRGRRLAPPPGRQTRPTTDLVRGALFNILSQRIRGSRFLDLFAGTGAVGLEAVSRGAAEVAWVESDRKVLAVLRGNVQALAPERLGGIVAARARDYLAALPPGRFDLVFADPPYADDLAPLGPSLAAALAPGGLLVVEHATASPPLPPPGLAERFRKRYGGTSLAGFEAAQP